MSSSAERAVERVIDTMRKDYSEQLTVDDMARAAMFSKFHFTRIFQRVTGISPRRFLSAIRLQEAKRLLLSTQLNVADISMLVGYNSVGTFSTRFTRSVGLSPTTYRQMGGIAQQISTPSGPPARGMITGDVGCADPAQQPPGVIFLGLFRDRIPEGTPVRCTVLERPGPYRFDGVPDGEYHLLSQSVPGRLDIARNDGVMVASVGPVTIGGTTTSTARVRLKPLTKMDPPVLLALLDARLTALAQIRSGPLAA